MRVPTSAARRRLPRRRPPLRALRGVGAFLGAVAVLLLAAAPAAADEYDPQEAGHPVRILAYALHPVGVLLDVLIFRPVHWIGSVEGLDELFGHEPYED